MKVVALVPAYNEERRIAATVKAILEIPEINAVSVIDDGSSDSTAEAARNAGAQVISLARNSGKGAALQAGIDSLSQWPDILVLLDADLEQSASQVSLLLKPVVDGEADMTIAQFPKPATKAGFGFVMRLANFGIRSLGGPFHANAPLSGQRVINAEALRCVLPFASGYGVEVALTIRALRQGMRLLEVPTTMRHAATGRDISGIIHRGRQFLHVALALLRLAFERR